MADDQPVDPAPVPTPDPTPVDPPVDPVALIEQLAESVGKLKIIEAGQLQQIADLKAQLAAGSPAPVPTPVDPGTPAPVLSQADIDKAVAAQKATDDQALADAVAKVKAGAKAIISDLELKESQADENAKAAIDAL